VGKKKKRKDKPKRKVEVLRDAKGQFRGTLSTAPIPAMAFVDNNPPKNDSNPTPESTDSIRIAYSALQDQFVKPHETPYDKYKTLLIHQVSQDTGISPDSILEALQIWRQTDHVDYEDYPAPSDAFRYDLHPDAPEDSRERKALRKLGYEHFLRQPHPVFVYGTLRQGQGNSILMDSAREETVVARMHGVSMYTKHWGFPYAKEDSDLGSSITGEIVWLSDSREGDEARTALDYLEGFNSDFPSSSHYERVEREVVFAPSKGAALKKTKVWVYFARGSAARSLTESDRLESGDWVKEVNTRRA